MTVYFDVHEMSLQEIRSFRIPRESDVASFHFFLNYSCELGIKFRAEVILPVSSDTLK